MKKYFTLLVALLVGMVAMAEKVTDYTQIVSGKTYLIGATTGGTDYYLSVNGSSAATVAGTAGTKAAATQFVFKGTDVTWTIQFAGGANYMSLPSSKNNGKVVVADAAADWTLSNNEGLIRMSVGNYSLQKNYSGQQFGSYADTQTDVWLEEVNTDDTRETATLTWSDAAATVTIDGNDNVFPTLATTPEHLTGVTFTSSNTKVATVSADGSIELVAAGQTTITAQFAGNDSYKEAADATYVLTVLAAPASVVPGTYEITPNNIFFNCESFTNKPAGFTTATGQQDAVTVLYTAAKSAYINDSQCRVYSGSKLGFSVPEGFAITKIAFTADGTNWAGTHTASVGSMTDSKTWEGSANEVTITFGGTCRITTIAVTYAKEVKMTGLAISGTPAATTYNAGESFSTEGLTVTATYEDDTQKDVTAEVEWTVSPEALAAGTTKVEVMASIGNITSDVKEYQVIVSAAKTLVGLVASGTPAEMWKGDAFTTTGMTFTALYDDDTDEEVDAEELTFTGYDMTTAGEQTVTVSYTYLDVTKTAEYKINLKTIANTIETAYTAAQAQALIDAGKDLNTEVYVKGEVSTIQSTSVSSAGKINFYIDADAFEFYGCLGLDGEKFEDISNVVVGANVVGLGFLTKYNTTYEFKTGCKLVSYSVPDKEIATIDAEYASELTVETDDEYVVDYNGDGELTVTSSDEAVAEAIIEGKQVLISALAAGTTTITISAPATDKYTAVSMKYTLTVSQPVVAAALPFSYDKGKTAIESTDGMKQTGLGNDYNSAPRLKFDSTGDNLIINFNGKATVLQYTVKGNSFSGGIFDVLESADGNNYTAVKTYTTLGAVSVEACPLAADTRYVKFLYTEKVGGNVALGGIKIYDGYLRSVVAGSYGTICLPCDVNEGDLTGAEFYTIENVDGGSGLITLSEQLTALEAGKPYIFKATASTVACAYTGQPVAQPAADAFLTGVFEDTEAPVGSYVLQRHDDVVGFYQVDDVKPTVAANRAYLTFAGKARACYFDDEATAILGIKATEAGTTVYNIAGQRVGKADKGLFIIGGKKVLK